MSCWHVGTLQRHTNNIKSNSCSYSRKIATTKTEETEKIKKRRELIADSEKYQIADVANEILLEDFESRAERDHAHTCIEERVRHDH